MTSLGCMDEKVVAPRAHHDHGRFAVLRNRLDAALGQAGQVLACLLSEVGPLGVTTGGALARLEDIKSTPSFLRARWEK